MKMYEFKTAVDVDYARTRLIGTIVMYKDIPVTVYDVSRTNIYCKHIVSGEEYSVQLEEIDITPVSLGYSNDHVTSYYLCRIPMRNDWRQGLRNHTLSTPHGRMVEVNNKALYNTIKGIYPSFKETVDLVKKYEKRAFSRNFCITNTNLIEYKGIKIVGEVVNNNQYKLYDKFEWVIESLEEVLAA